MPVLGETLAIVGLENPSVNEFLAHPDFRQIVAFFLGWVFISSLSCIIYSPIFRRFISGLFARSDNNSTDLESSSEKSVSTPTSDAPVSILLTQGDNLTLVFTLCICLAFASIAYFSSLLTFDSNNGEGPCAFVIAWGGMAAQSARLVGMLILSFELRQLGISRRESIIFWIWLGIGIAFLFVTNALGTGTTKIVQQLAISLCYRRHYLPTSLVSSLIYFFLELYVVIRLALLIAPTFMQMRHRVGVMTDVRILKGLSLVLMELLTIVPSATFTSIPGEFIPFSVGSLAVLAAFNHCTPRPVELRVTSIPPSIDNSVPSRRSAAPTVHSVVVPVNTPALDPPSPPYRQSIPNHPFAAHSPQYPMSHRQLQPKSARSSLSVDSATAKSINGVVIQVASKASRAPITRMPHGIYPISSSARNIAPSENRDGAENPVLAPMQLGLSQQILPEQVKYAKQYSFKKPKPPPIFINTSSPPPQSSAGPITTRSPGSVIYGSDIIRVARQSNATDATRRTSHSVGTMNSLRHSNLTYSPRDPSISSTARSSRRYSLAYHEEMPALYEASIEGMSRTSRPRPPTFGEQSFQTAPIMTIAPPPRASTDLPPRPQAGHNSPRIRGPRPPPPSPSQADRAYLPPTLPERHRRRSRPSTIDRRPATEKF